MPRTLFRSFRVEQGYAASGNIIDSFMLWEDEFDQQVEEYNQRDWWLSDGDGFWN